MSLHTATASETRAGALATGGRLPRVNLLPPEVVESRRLRRTKGYLAVAVVATVAAAGGTYALAAQRVGEAEEALAASQATTAELRAEESQYAEVPQVLAEVSAAQDARASAMATDVLWHRYLEALTTRLPDGVWLTGVTATVAGPGGTAGTAPVPVAGTNPLATPGIGAVQFTGQARDFPEVAAWLDAVAQEQGWADAYVNSTTTSEVDGATVVDFVGKVVVTDAALSKRYDREAL